MLLRLKCMKQWQLNDARPHGRRRCAAQPGDHIELRHLCVGLKQRFLPEQFAQNAATTPHIDGWAVALLAQQQLWRSIPQRDHLVGVRSLTVLGIVETRQTKVGQFYFAPGEKRKVRLGI